MLKINEPNKQRNMKTIITNYRYWVLLALASVMIGGLVAMPSTDTSFSVFTVKLFVIKGVAFAALFAFCYYYMKWKDEGSISELTDLEEE